MRIWRNWNLLIFLVGTWNGVATLGNSLVVPQMLNIDSPYDPSKSSLRYISNRNKHRPTKISTQMFWAALFRIAKKNCKGIQCLATEDCINKTWFVHKMKYYFSMKKNVILFVCYSFLTLKMTVLPRLFHMFNDLPNKITIIWFWFLSSRI